MPGFVRRRPAATRPLELDSAPGRWLLLVAVLGSAVAQLEATVVNIGLPAIGDDLDAGVAALQWVLNGYLLTLAGLILIGGSLGDRYGRRRIFVLGVTIFTVTSLACAIAPTIEVLIAARLLQGVGGALLTPGSLAMLEALLREQDRARAIGAWSALGGVAGALGPLLGGWLVGFSWRWVFVIPVPLGILVAILGLTKIPESRDPTATGRIDLAGAALATVALAGITFALVQAPVGPIWLVVLAGVVGVGSAVIFWRVEHRTASPMLDPGIFSSRLFTVANALTFVVYAGLGGVFFLFVVFLQVSMGYSPLQAGLASLPITVLMLLLSSRAGALSERIGPRWPLTIGPVLIAAGMLLMVRISPGDGYVSHVLPAVVVLGLGLADDRRAGDGDGVGGRRRSARRDGLGGQQRGRPYGPARGHRRAAGAGRAHRGRVRESGADDRRLPPGDDHHGGSGVRRRTAGGADDPEPSVGR